VRSSRTRAGCALARAVAAVVALAAAALGCRADEEAPAAAVPAVVRPCESCHPDEVAAWRGSDHDRAMEVATAATVLGDFADAAVEDVRFRRDGDGFAIETAAGERLRVRYTFGVDPLQQYLVEAPGGRLQAFPIAWDVGGRRWLRIAAAAVPWTSRFHTWNTMCAECHSTGVDKGYDPAADRYATRFDAVDVGCAACHGDGARHAADPTQPIVARADVEACAPCHARRTAIAAAPGPAPAGSLFDTYRPLTLQDGLYFADGQILDEVFEYGSFAHSAMHERGVTCVDCHDPHSGRTAAGNAVCTACHNAAPPPRFAGLAQRPADVDTPAHHHHAPGSPGARCVACHMPARTYMVIDRRHDHGFRIPRPDLAAALGAPDACTLECHAGRDAAWAAATVAAWFPRARPRPAAFGEVLARARAGQAAPAELRALAVDAAQPAIVRATALELLYAAPADCLAAAAVPDAGLADRSPLVRSVAVACADSLAPAARAALVAAALADPVRLVRIEAARVLAGDAAAALGPGDAAAFAAARRELDAAYRLDLDRAEGWLNLALLAEAERRPADAITAYRRALALDPALVPARVRLRALTR
jgi:hypothetical protein